ncbi:MAG: NYN domain-containing protein [Sphingomonadaceae bacterium]
MSTRRTCVYIDGFNLYYGCLKKSKYKWLDLSKLCTLLLPDHTIVGIKYFTARVRPRPQDPTQGVRQATYLRALQTLPNLEIYEGHFLSHPAWRLLAPPPEGHTSLARTGGNGEPEYLDVPDGAQRAYVWETEEKGSDVNLAAHLLVDGFSGRYEFAVVISNDSDLASPIEMVRRELDLPVGIFNPHRNSPSAQLGKVAVFQRPIWPRLLKASQFPPVLSDKIGLISKPAEW